ncbi:bifunctional diaminohydroxyphosphoribosylaminopyrimidine deaminase/5-amino-6-(5-phosphoribosylamino)uracil reductase RibD [Pelagibius sp. 7325]|uniref:bifunctional diaminohydroxyphosphoribosylaminopyrimidine deaminase/5-amino-6-(5-phosphoribosylamino)uracil reductase RibD n=1 Tax=Pelagibius sp. 7325 TaxID=3131994 RepID=UPI00351D31A6
MRAALTLAARGLGRVAPNPTVGCIIVKDGRVVGRGWTRPGGRPHAETEALKQAGKAAAGATVYVTLEPCAHHGKTPPCAEALAAAGVARVVAALEDPDTRVAGRGMEILRQAGIATEIGLCRAQAERLNAGFLKRVIKGQPLVVLKLATSLDGKIATHSGQSQWITGPLARRRAHLLRSRADAIMVGSGTAVFDNPRLDVRLPGLEDRSPLRVVVDGRLRLPLTHDLVARAGAVPTLLVTHDGNPGDRLRAYEDAGVEVVQVETDADGHVSLDATLSLLGGRGITRLLVEGGGHLAASLLRAGLVDRLAWFQAPVVIGGDGVAAVSGFGVDRLDEAPKFLQAAMTQLGRDRIDIFSLDV